MGSAYYPTGSLSEEFIARGINRAFHASLLKPHALNYDRRFPVTLLAQIPIFGGNTEEWIVEAIDSHHGKGPVGSKFEILWKAGDKTWASYREVAQARLIGIDRYYELM